eukprot:CAMPEP_0201741486 /NCGR_PEP_ID=MMETSP0593-20130828/46838_1 /ASSEMBLY_ACC=CAM_ASM_000672 /TAXON_ID=267983 /ORGANISM="Skeletonema japonicum, Strain CCMP2506" /LENGTH=422 /DNA_ID=CAMNT_0048235823 /DNA_START=75 /DNA_END=1343 /DNA_ORIENTATION=-
MPPRPHTSKRRSQPSGLPSSIRRRNAPSFNSAFEEDSRSNTISLFSFSIPNPLSYFRRSDDDYSSTGPAASYNTTKYILYGGVIFIMLASLFDTYFRTPTKQGGDGEIVGAALPHVTSDGKYHGRYPNSLLTLFYPYTLFRDVVLDQPVDVNDVPFFWHAHVSDEIPVKKVLKTCYGADLIELDTEEDVEKAKELKLVSSLASQERVGPGSLKEKLYNGQRKQPIVITSPHIREVAELFNQDNMGRMFSFYRHPIDYDLHPNLKTKLPPDAVNNFMSRLLSDVHTGELGFKELGIGKQVIRQSTLSGTRDLMSESILRFGQYFGWVPTGGEGTKLSEEADNAIAKSCIEDILQSYPGERYADHNSPEWQAFYKANKMDCQLYELARSTWRAQIQTIIPLSLQKKRAGEGDDDEKNDEDGEEE